MLKKFFIPNKENEYRPQSLKRTSITALLVTVLLLEFFSIGFILSPQLSSKISNLTAVLPGVLIAKVNKTRVSENLTELKENAVLAQAAQLKAQDMAKRGYFSHVDPDGNQPWYYFRQAGYDYKIAGENLAVNFVDSSEVHRAWMNSPTHKANIVQPRFTEIGIATADGIYKGRDAIFVVQFFAVPNETNSWFTLNTPPTQNSVSADSQVLGAFTENILASPRTTISYALIAIAFLILISLILKISFARKIQFKDLILNGLLLLAITLSAIFIHFLLSDYFGEVANIQSGESLVVN
jgi:uncharacterized protein YkwD